MLYEVQATWALLIALYSREETGQNCPTSNAYINKSYGKSYSGNDADGVDLLIWGGLGGLI